MSANNLPFLSVFLLLSLLRFDSIPGLEAAGKLASIPGVYVFGDSLVDAGNNNYLPFSVAKGNYPHNGIDFPKKKATGRFCNGKNFADVIAEKIGLPLPPPYLSLRGLLKWRKRESAAVTGVNFASGGAGIFDGSSQFPGQAIPLSQQLKHWLSIHKALTRKLGRSKAQIHLSKSLFVMVIGSNDLLNYIRSSQLRRKSSSQQYTQSVVDRFKAQLKTVQETGARRFLILGVAELGCMPSRREKNSTTHECNKEANMLASLYNKALIKMLQQLKEELKSSMAYSYFDMFNSVHDIVSNPTHYGFSDVTSACCGSGVLNAELPCFPVSNLCSDRTKYLFWDRYGHPTEAAARTIVNFVLSEDTQYSSPLTLTQLVSS
ncbi:PREDICTED: GDSL esterase/lipase At5g55050-like [Brassica oleracea var. oleracea]|uniref:GDSL esterase/lipase At5g55050-like n=1 Tax=Brassica oleracea var. oleracea TaxID=109376 RepID=A0A0D3B3E7_BRAOL|nr:PREDICTED: GDSL esterase/lipase At5g55050-like [Brassica oleracea var. oleracea]